ncbi:MAG: ABC transporter substrate-binding protein [Dehalococcoidia bacterium]|nr:ABC transporter substrate-binding protein [Dehalococcoidia bacterium]
MSSLRHALLGTVLMLTACQAPAAPAPAPAAAVAQPRPAATAVRAERVRLAWADAGVLTPFRVSTAGPGGATLISLIYDTLTWKDEAGIIPWLATRWTIGPDATTYTFTLAPNVEWHDGRPLTAADVAFTFDFYSRFPYRWMATEMVARAEATSPSEVAIVLKRPYAAFLEDIAGVVPVIPKHVWETVSDPRTYDSENASVGSGPFILADYRPAEGSYRLIANRRYFRGEVVVGEFQSLNIPTDTRVLALQQGRVDLINSADAGIAEIFRGDPRIAVHETDPLSIVRLAVNTERAPLNRREVRQALMYAIDRATIAEVATKGAPIVGNAGVVPPSSPWYNPNVRQYPYDPAAARALLRGEQLTIELLTDPANREPDLIAPMLQAVGITLVIKRVDSATRTALLREGNFQLAQVAHIGVGGDPDFLRRWYAGEEANDFAQGSIFNNAEFDRLARDSAATVDERQRRAIVNRMQELLAEELPTIVLYHRRFYWAYDRTVFAPMTTWGGLMNGIPFPHNKLAFLRRG